MAATIFIILEGHLELPEIERGRFSEWRLKSIFIPGSVQTLGQSCFDPAAFQDSSGSSHLQTRRAGPGWMQQDQDRCPSCHLTRTRRCCKAGCQSCDRRDDTVCMVIRSVSLTAVKLRNANVNLNYLHLRLIRQWRHLRNDFSGAVRLIRFVFLAPLTSPPLKIGECFRAELGRRGKRQEWIRPRSSSTDISLGP
jgi:hypothetical protein